MIGDKVHHDKDEYIGEIADIIIDIASGLKKILRELPDNLNNYYQLSNDEELFDVVTGFEAIK